MDGWFQVYAVQILLFWPLSHTVFTPSLVYVQHLIISEVKTVHNASQWHLPVLHWGRESESVF